MKSTTAMATGIAAGSAGAALMFFLDPRLGSTRRAHVRDKVVHANHVWRHDLAVAARDLENRARGLVADVRPDQAEVADAVLCARVRARLGHVCGHPHAIDVIARDGVVELRGLIVESELDEVLSAVRAVRGVEAVDDDLEVHETADVPSLQGGVARSIPRRLYLPPGASLVMGSVGLMVAISGMAVRRSVGLPIAVLGGAVMMLATRLCRR
jgi:hypothetical protein